MTVRTALSLAAVAAAAVLGAAVPASAAGGPQAPCEIEYGLYQQGFTVVGQKFMYCEGKTPSVTPAAVQTYVWNSGFWATTGAVEGNKWVHHCLYPGPTQYRLKVKPEIKINGTCW